jgi:hypothetical protein
MPHYKAVLAALHDLHKPGNYLDIGVHTGESLRLANRRTLCVGVDPCPEVGPELERHSRIERTTSDEFFASGRADELFPSGIEMAFIDGMHLFEYALRDFINVEQRSRDRTLVVIHDLIPQDERSAARHREDEAATWMGDVWKLLLVLRDHRPDLQIDLVDTPPSGLGLVRGLKASNHVLEQKYEDLLSEYGKLTFDDWGEVQHEVLSDLLRSPESLRLHRRLKSRAFLGVWRRRALHPRRSFRRFLSRKHLYCGASSAPADKA